MSSKLCSFILDTHAVAKHQEKLFARADLKMVERHEERDTPKVGKLLILIFIVLSSVGCEKSKIENTVVSNAMKEFKTFCIGRHSIELPKSFVFSDGTTAVFIPLRSHPNEEKIEIQIGLIKSGSSLNEFQD